MNTKLNIFRLFVGLVFFISGLVLLTGSVTPVRAATITVTSMLDESDGSCSDGDCSLRDALATAVPGDTISIPSGSYVLTLGQLNVTKNLTLVGGTPAPVLDGNASSRVLSVEGDLSLTINHLIITNGSSEDGGGLYVSAAELTLIDSDVRNNTASNNGGGILLSGGGSVLLTSGVVSQNTAVAGGGGIYIMTGSLVQDSGAIENNSAATGGGVHVNLVQAAYTLNAGEVRLNSSTALETGGGGVYVAQGTFTVNGGQIAENSGVRGGGIEAANGKVFLNGGAIRENLAQYGGGVYLSFPDAFLTQTGGGISYNSSSSSEFGGGGVYGFQGSMALSGGIVSYNTAVTDGGGINIRFGDLTITGGEVVHNEAGAQGGGIFVEEAELTIANLQLGNNAAVEGGGLYVDTLANMDLAQTAVYSNTATLNGGGLLLRGSSLLTNATVSHNQAQNNGGGFWLAAGSTTLQNVTIAENMAVSGGGIFNNSAVANLHNSLLASNSANPGPNCSGSFTSSGYNLIQDDAGCVLNGDLTGIILGQDPLLEPLTLYSGFTFVHPLVPASPAVDAGDPVDCPYSDQQGRPRPLDGDLNETAVCDIGAFEYGIPLRVGNITVTEGDSGSAMANFPVTLDFAATVPVTVTYASDDQTAVAGLDYTAVADTLTFSPGETAKTVEVPILGDLLDEADETFVVTLNSPINAYLADDQGIGTIVDNDPAPSLSIGDVTVTEGDSGSNTASFSVTLDAPSGKTVQVSYASANGTATVGADYTAVSGTLTFLPEETSKIISVLVLGDLLDEANETFSLNLSNPQNATLGKSQGIGTIQDNDPLPDLIINNVTITETDGAPQTMSFTVSLSAASGKTITVNYATADQTAVAGRDYTAKSGTLTFTPGQLSKTISITILSDLVVEPTETFVVTLSAPVNAMLGASQGTGTILDNDPLPPTEPDYLVYLPVVIRP